MAGAAKFKKYYISIIEIKDSMPLVNPYARIQFDGSEIIY